jgi:thiamine transporter ThiT
VNGTHHARPPVPEWSSPAEAVRLIALGYTFRTGFRVALVVGTLLSIVNQGSVLVAGDATASTAARIAINYLIPFVVSSIGYLAPFRTPRAAAQG